MSTQTGSVWRQGSRAMVSRMNTDWSDVAKDTATLAMRALGLNPFDGPVALLVSVVMPRLKDMRHEGPDPNGGPDLDNAVKGPKDAWQGVLYKKDSQIKKLTLEKVWASEHIPIQARGGLAVTIYPLT